MERVELVDFRAVGALIYDPDVVVGVDSHRVGEHHTVKAVANFTHEIPVRGELEQARRFAATGKDLELTLCSIYGGNSG